MAKGVAKQPLLLLHGNRTNIFDTNCGQIHYWLSEHLDENAVTFVFCQNSALTTVFSTSRYLISKAK